MTCGWPPQNLSGVFVSFERQRRGWSKQTMTARKCGGCADVGRRHRGLTTKPELPESERPDVSQNVRSLCLVARSRPSANGQKEPLNSSAFPTLPMTARRINMGY